MYSSEEIERHRAEAQRIKSANDEHNRQLTIHAINALGIHDNVLGRKMPADIAQSLRIFWISIHTWVNGFLEPILGSRDVGSNILTDLRRNTGIGKPFYKLISNSPDLGRLIRYPDEDYRLLEAVIIRFLVDQIFERGLYDSKSQPGLFLRKMQDAVSNYIVRRPHGQIMVQLYRAHTYNALLSLPETETEFWGPYMSKVMTRLRRLLGCLRAAPHFETYMKSFEAKILPTARQLHEEMASSMTRYWFEVEKFEGTQNREARIQRLLSNHTGTDLSWRDTYYDIIRAGRVISIEQVNREELYQNLDPLCTIQPRLMMSTLEYDPTTEKVTYKEAVVTTTTNVTAYGDDMERNTPREAGVSLFWSVCRIVAE
ncbi:hypothetical protein F5Y12DRAFT_800087 [Xylaria sp. FL1777]|nr:hypothetical protein F5Y12DRAFT_800087 [Xylaria sp. FL1777]